MGLKLLLGTGNQAKISDYKTFLRHAELELVTLSDIGFMDEPLEIGESFFENAMQKARFYAERTEYPTLADDGGFEVDFLDGRPGIESNRWLGPHATDQDKIDRIIELLRGVPTESRGARLSHSVVVYFPEVRDYIEESFFLNGVVPERPSQKIIPYFPYRSVLYIPELKKYSTDLSEEEMERLGHRARACKLLLLKLEPYLSD